MGVEDFNTNHPELRDDEQFIGNFPSKFIRAHDHQHPFGGHKVWRAGKIAHDPSGKEIPDGRPVFVPKLAK